jgi:hypothetical protein
MHADVSVVVDGALEEDETFFDYALMEQYLSEVEADAVDHGYLTEVYVVWHDHEPGDCDCIQYLTDHHPTYTYNGPA